VIWTLYNKHESHLTQTNPLSVINKGRLSVDCWQHLSTSSVAKCCQQQTDNCRLFIPLGDSMACMLMVRKSKFSWKKYKKYAYLQITNRCKAVKDVRRKILTPKFNQSVWLANTVKWDKERAIVSVSLTFIPSQRDTALNGLNARNVRSARNAPMLPAPIPSALQLTIDIWHTNKLINTRFPLKLSFKLRFRSKPKQHRPLSFFQGISLQYEVTYWL